VHRPRQVARLDLLVEAARIFVEGCELPMPRVETIHALVHEKVEGREIVACARMGIMTDEGAVSFVIQHFQSRLFQMKQFADKAPWDDPRLLESVRAGLFGPWRRGPGSMQYCYGDVFEVLDEIARRPEMYVGGDASARADQLNNLTWFLMGFQAGLAHKNAADRVGFLSALGAYLSKGDQRLERQRQTHRRGGPKSDSAESAWQTLWRAISEFRASLSQPNPRERRAQLSPPRSRLGGNLGVSSVEKGHDVGDDAIDLSTREA
jgi:hypothetical protein